MAVTTRYKRALLGKLYRNKGAQTLLEALEAKADASVTSTEDGSFITSTSSNGTSVSFGTDRDSTPTELAEAMADLLDLYTLTAANISGTTDADIYAGMLARLTPCRSFTNDWVSLRNGQA